MSKKTVSAMIIVMLLTSMLTLAFKVQPTSAPATARTIVVPDDYSTIQQAVDAASSGDTVYVRAGTYYERVVIAKALSLVGEDRATTIIDGSGWVSTVSTVDYVTVTGFTIRSDAQMGIVIRRYCNVSGNNVESCHYGIILSSSSTNSRVVGNNVINNYYGIFLSASSSNEITENTVTNNGYGIYASSSDYNRIVENSITANDWVGIYLTTGCSHNTLDRNSLTNNLDGMMIDSSYQDWHDSNRVTGNTIENSSGCGINVEWSGYNDIIGNNITAGNVGIQFYGSSASNNTLVGNNIARNHEGIRTLFGCEGNRIYHNNIIGNTEQAIDDNSSSGINFWDNDYPSGGNYWSDYRGTDGNHDGIGDIPYNVSYYEKDNYPLINPKNIVYPWGDDDKDGILNYLDIPELAIHTTQWTRRILGFDWSVTLSTSDGQIDYDVISSLYKSWGIDMTETQEIGKHLTFTVLDSDALLTALYWLQSNAPYVVTQSFIESMTRHLCSDGHFRLLFFFHYDIDLEKAIQYLLRIEKLIAMPTSTDLTENYLQALTAFSYFCNSFDAEVYQLEGVDSVQASLQFDWTDIAQAVEAAKLGLSDFSAMAGAMVDLVEMTIFLIQVPVLMVGAPEIFAAFVGNALIKTFKFVLDLAAFGRQYTDTRIVNWIKTILITIDPPGEKLVLQLRNPVTGVLLLGFNSTSNTDISTFPYGIYVSEDDSALMILARDSTNYNLTVTRNSTGTSLPYTMIVWDCQKNTTAITGGFLESEQATSSNIRIESDTLRMSYLQVHANFSTLTPDVGEQVEVNVSVTDNVGSAVDDLTVVLHLNDEQIFAQALGEGQYRAEINTTGMLGFYNVTIYTANPPDGFLQGIVTCPFEVGLHDIAISRVDLRKSNIGQGFPLMVNLTIQNPGSYSEIFNLTLFANTTSIASQNVTISNKSRTVVSVPLNTTGFAYGNYTISAYALPVPGETNTADNNFTDGTIAVTIPGDVDGNFKVDMGDINALCSSFGSTIGTDGNYWHHPACILCPHSSNLDIDGNGKIDMGDIVTALGNFGQHYP